MKKEKSVFEYIVIFLGIGFAGIFGLGFLMAINIDFVLLIILFSIIILSISIYMNRTIKTKNYNKDTENLVSPILAETIVDGKTNLKNLIMTAIIEFNIKGNVKILDNKSIKLIHNDNLEDYEKEILKLIFQGDTKITSFSAINEMFSESENQTFNFTEILNEVKIKIQEYLYDLKIISKKYTRFISGMQAILTVITLNLPAILNFDNLEFDFRLFYLYILLNLVIGLILFESFFNKSSFKHFIISIKKNMEKKEKIEKDNSDVLMIFPALIFLTPSVISLFSIMMSDKILFIKLLVIIILNTLIIIVNRTSALTEHGKKERRKLLELKNYINEYSLIKDRDLKAVVMWDEYLAYATAFGIPSKITSEIYESWYNMNISIQFMKSFF